MSTVRGRSWGKFLALSGALACAIALAACAPATVIEVTPTPTSTPEPAPLEVTYIDNASFLIASGGQKILIDAHATLPEEIRTSIEQAEPPFDDVDVVLATHIHADHFDARLVATHMAHNSRAVFASTEEAIEELGAVVSNFEAVQERMRGFELEVGERMRANLNGVELEILNLPHDAPVENVGFILYVGGNKLLHTGDTFPTHIEVYDFPVDHLNVALVPYFFLIDQDYMTEDGRSVLLDMIQADRIIPIHYSPTIWGLENILEDELTEGSQTCMVFHERMEMQIVE